MKTVTDRNLGTGITTVRLDGELSVGTVPEVGTAMAKVAAECPSAMVVDLSGMRHQADALLSVFAAVTHDAQLHWGVPVLLCGASSLVRDGLSPYRTYVALYEDSSQAALAVNASVPRWLCRRLPPDRSSAAAARHATGDACLAWGLSHLHGLAQLVANELAANAIVHAGSDFDLTVVHTGRYLRIGVRDDAEAMPRAPAEPAHTSTLMPPGSGRGLRIVAAAATHWGATPLPDGKVVWALLRSDEALR